MLLQVKMSCDMRVPSQQMYCVMQERYHTEWGKNIDWQLRDQFKSQC